MINYKELRIMRKKGVFDMSDPLQDIGGNVYAWLYEAELEAKELRQEPDWDAIGDDEALLE
jgi:hypothetical protein